MTAGLPVPVRGVLDRGSFCWIAAGTPGGPHVTPMVFAVAGGRLWVTTSRGSVKARAWRRDPRVAGLVQGGTDAVAFVGTAVSYDLLDAETWGRSVREGPLLALAATRFTRKNARFFAGYAVDARQVPLAWTPPGRVFVELRLERSVLLEDGRPGPSWGDWGDAVPGRDRFRAVRAGPGVFDGLPRDVRDALGTRGPGVLAAEGAGGVVVLPAAWVVDGAGLYAVLPAETLALAGCREPDTPAALGVDRASWWRARNMVGAMARGTGELYALDRLSAGATSAGRIAGLAGREPEGSVLVRLRPARLVWWRGWSSGTVALA